jgi:drug/metabolite transporter, DME family
MPFVLGHRFIEYENTFAYTKRFCRQRYLAYSGGGHALGNDRDITGTRACWKLTGRHRRTAAPPGWFCTGSVRLPPRWTAPAFMADSPAACRRWLYCPVSDQFFWAVAKTGVAVGTIVGIGSSPVFAGILEYLISKKKPGRRWYLSTLLAISGCLLLLLQSGDLHINGIGILLALVAGLSYASYALGIKMLLPGRSAEDVTAVVFCLGALFLSPVLFMADLQWLAEVNGWLMMLHLGLLATALSYWLFASGLATVPASTAVTLTLAEPLTAAVLGVLVVGERLTPTSALGLLLVLSALLLLMLPSGSTYPADRRK